MIALYNEVNNQDIFGQITQNLTEQEWILAHGTILDKRTWTVKRHLAIFYGSRVMGIFTDRGNFFHELVTQNIK